MSSQTGRAVWDPKSDIPLSAMNTRIKNISSQRSWKEALRIIIEKGIPFDGLKVAEVGCGSGTTALTFALMGASVTLIDFNQKALELASGIYRMYDCHPELINADCLRDPEDRLRNNFDLVVSSGLMEHFTGSFRERCLKYHKDLLKNGGFALITVPNCNCPWYRFVKFFRVLTKTWEIDVEIPFSARELNFISEKNGFKTHYVIANGDWLGDLRYYVRGFLSAVGDILPGPIRNTIKGWKSRLGPKPADHRYGAKEMRFYLGNMISEGKSSFSAKPVSSGTANQFNSDLALLAFKG